MITELRYYRIKPERLESWVEFFKGAARENERCGIRVEFAGVDRESSTFIWARTFEDEADRIARKDDFYGGDWWLEREDVAMDHVLDYTVRFLDTTLVRRDGPLDDVSRQLDGELPGSRGDTPPDGWIASAGRSFVRNPQG